MMLAVVLRRITKDVWSSRQMREDKETYWWNEEAQKSTERKRLAKKSGTWQRERCKGRGLWSVLCVAEH